MKKHIKLIAAATAALVIAGNAATVSVATTAPTFGGDDIAHLQTPTGNANVWSDRGIVGQTFTTSTNAGGYTLNSITVQLNEGANAPITDWKDFRFRVSTVTGGISDPIIDVIGRMNTEAANDDYLTFAFDTPIALSASTVYGFEVGITGSQEGWQSGITNVRTTTTDYTSGARYGGPQANTGSLPIDSTFTMGSLQGDDVVFALDMDATVVPEPSALVLFGLSGLFLLRRRR